VFLLDALLPELSPERACPQEVLVELPKEINNNGNEQSKKQQSEITSTANQPAANQNYNADSSSLEDSSSDSDEVCIS